MKFITLLFTACQANQLRHQEVLANQSGLDINQKVYIENAPVLGDGAGEGDLNQCKNFAAAHVSNPEAPKIKVCGTSIKLTAYVRGRCQEYHDKTWTVGACDTGAPADTCVEMSPADDARLGAAQSYKIEMC